MKTTFFIIASFDIPVKQWQIRCSEALCWRRTDLQTFKCFSCRLLLKFWHLPHTQKNVRARSRHLSGLALLLLLLLLCSDAQKHLQPPPLCTMVNFIVMAEQPAYHLAITPTHRRPCSSPQKMPFERPEWNFIRAVLVIFDSPRWQTW